MQYLSHLNFDKTEETEIYSKFNNKKCLSHLKFNNKKYLSHLKFNKPESTDDFPDFNNQNYFDSLKIH